MPEPRQLARGEVRPLLRGVRAERRRLESLLPVDCDPAVFHINMLPGIFIHALHIFVHPIRRGGMIAWREDRFQTGGRALAVPVPKHCHGCRRAAGIIPRRREILESQIVGFLLLIFREDRIGHIVPRHIRQHDGCDRGIVGEINIEGRRESHALLHARNGMALLAVSQLMSHDVRQLVVVKRVEGALIDAHHAAQAHEGVDLLVGRDIEGIFPADHAAAAEPFVNALHPGVRRRVIIHAGLLLALIQELELRAVIESGIIFRYEEHRRSAVEQLLRERRRGRRSRSGKEKRRRSRCGKRRLFPPFHMHPSRLFPLIFLFILSYTLRRISVGFLREKFLSIRLSHLL